LKVLYGLQALFFLKFIYRAKNKTVKQKLKYKSENIATFKLSTYIYYLEYTTSENALEVCLQALFQYHHSSPNAMDFY